MSKRFDISHELQDLAREVQSLVPDHRNPERYHLTKSEIAARLKALSRSVMGGNHDAA